MMASLKLVAALVVALSAIVLAVEAEKDLWQIGEELGEEIEGSQLDQNKPEEVYLFAKNYISQLEWEDQELGNELLEAWDQVLHESDQCVESRLPYIRTISLSGAQFRSSLITLKEATKKYAENCVTQAYITERTKSQVDYYLSKSRFNNITDFIDDQFIADYWSEHSDDRRLKNIEREKATKAIAKAIMRDRDNNIKKLGNEKEVQAYLERRFYEPCSEYFKVFHELDKLLYSSDHFLKGGSYQKFVALLDKETQNAFFRYHLCDTRDINKTFAKFLGFQIRHDPNNITKQVVSDLKRMSANRS